MVFTSCAGLCNYSVSGWAKELRPGLWECSRSIWSCHPRGSDCSIPDECKCCPPQVTVTTNEAGQYEVRIPPGNYSFKARDTQIKVTVEDRDKNVNITVNDPPQ